MTSKIKFNDLITIIDNSNLVDKAEAKLLEVFIKKGLKPGDSIPKEIELVEAMGVSRTVIRESLNRLRTLDIIESKKHRGSIMKSPNLFSTLQKSMIPNILGNATLIDIFELRLVIEVGLADFIVQRATPADITSLSKIVQKEPEKSDAVLFDVDHEVRFHSMLYKITGNESIIQFQLLLLPLFNFAYTSGLINIPIKRETYVSHKGLVEILKKGDPAEFRAAMRSHLENHFQRILNRDVKIEQNNKE